nr:hypothetical protein [Gilliamella apicola]
MGYIRYRQSQLIIGTIKNATVSLVCGKWFVSIQTEYEQVGPIHQSNTEIGIIWGLAVLRH